MINTLKDISKHIMLFVIGGIIYVWMEILWRGYSHWSMFLLGGLCFILIGLVNEHISWDDPLSMQMLYGAVLITVLEFLTGVIVNIIFGLNVWDYSNKPLNYMGQICLSNSVLWYFLAGVAIALDDYLRYLLFNEEKPKYRIF